MVSFPYNMMHLGVMNHKWVSRMNLFLLDLLFCIFVFVVALIPDSSLALRQSNQRLPTNFQSKIILKRKQYFLAPPSLEF